MPIFEVQVAPTRIGRGRYRVDLTWTPLGAALLALSEALAGLRVAKVAGMAP